MLQYYPWVSARRHFGFGFELAYQYQGLNRRLEAPATIERSRAGTQSITLGVAGRLRPHPQWFGFQPGAHFGVADLAGEEYLLADVEVAAPERSGRVTVGGSLALCTWWDVICVSGVADYIPGAGGVALAFVAHLAAKRNHVVERPVHAGRLIPVHTIRCCRRGRQSIAVLPHTHGVGARFYQCDQASAALFRREAPQRCFNRRRVMGEVIEYPHAPRLTAQLQASLNAAKLCQGCRGG